MHTKTNALFATTLVCGAFSGSAIAASIYSMDFSVLGQGSTHQTPNNPVETSPIVGENWTLAFGSVQSDSTLNEFITQGNVMRVQDWGGLGTVTSDVINIAESGLVDIAGKAIALGFSIASENITWFYQINALPKITFEISGPISLGTPADNTFSSIAVSGGDELLVGFSVNVNGAGEGVEISALDVDFTAIPQPAALAAGLPLLGLLTMTRRSRRTTS